jgi:hypothetical protein
MKRSAKEVFDTGDTPVSVEQMDAKSQMPDCPHCRAPMEVFHDPKKTFERLSERLTNEGYVSLLRSLETDQIEGFAYAYGATLKEQFDSEWSNQYNYMAEQRPDHSRPFEHFLNCLNQAIPDESFDENTAVISWNCVALSSKARGSKVVKKLIGNLFEAVPIEKHNRYDIGEVIEGSKWHQMLKRAGTIDVPGFLEGEEIITGARFGDYVKGFRAMWCKAVK